MAEGMVSRIFLAALLGGVIAGVFLTGIQRIAVIPMVFEAESYETAAPAGDGHSHSHSHDHGAAGEEEEAWGPADGMERTFYTLLTNVLASVGFALVLVACYALRGGVDWRKGLLWGLGGFAAFSLAPGLGLPPELPGAAAAELGARQVWWLATVVLTAGGLATLAFAPRLPIKAVGVVLVALPHVIGAPQPDAHGGLAPAELEHAFIYANFATNAVFWVVLGGLTALVFNWSPRGGGSSTAAA